MGNEDDLLAQFLVLFAKASVCNVAELQRLENKKREGTRLDCATVPRMRKSVLRVHREMGNIFISVVRFECRTLRSAVCCA